MNGTIAFSLPQFPSFFPRRFAGAHPTDPAVKIHPAHGNGFFFRCDGEMDR